jgi:hypothetical protein
MNTFCYLTRDEVNRAMAQLLASSRGLAISSAESLDGVHDHPNQTVIVDWDSFPTEQQQSLFAWLTRPNAKLCCVHSYNLDDRMAAILRHRQVIVCRQLSFRLFVEIELATLAWLLDPFVLNVGVFGDGMYEPSARQHELWYFGCPRVAV